MGKRFGIVGLAGVLAAMGVIAIAPQAQAAHHFVKIREVYPGDPISASNEFVELQLGAAGENNFSQTGPGMFTTTVSLHAADGAITSSATFDGVANLDPPNGENQRSVLAATPSAVSLWGKAADLPLPAVDGLSHAGGAVCFTSTAFGALDCVPWGNFTGSVTPLPSPTSNPAAPASIPNGNALRRDISANCSTLHETGANNANDDTNDAASDFDLVLAPSPQNNADPVTDGPCPPTTPGGGGTTTQPPVTPVTPTPTATRKCPKGKKLKKGKCVKKKKKK